MEKSTAILPPGLAQFSLNQEKKTDRGELGQSEFLQLMLTQIKHQDPLNPMESGEFLSQLAQFGTVNGITELQASFQSLASAMQSSQALQASTMVGRSVLVAGATGSLVQGQPMQGGVDVPASTPQLVVNISDASGQLVRQLDLGIQPAGITRFIWDGLDESGNPLPSGIYFIGAQAVVRDEVVSQNTLVEARVESVTLGSDGTTALNLRGIGPVPMNQVRELL